MVVADGENYAPQSTSFETEEEVFPACRTLPIGHLHAEHLAPALPIDPDGHEHRSRADHSILPHFLIPRIDDQIGILAIEFAAGKASQFLIELLVDPLIALALKLCPQSSSLIALTFRVDTPWIYISR